MSEDSIPPGEPTTMGEIPAHDDVVEPSVPRPPPKQIKKRGSLTPPKAFSYSYINAAVVVAFAIVIIALTYKTVTTQFLRGSTDALWRCKKDPSWDRYLCPKLLANRTPKERPREELDMRGWGTRSTQFQLGQSESGGNQ